MPRTRSRAAAVLAAVLWIALAAAASPAGGPVLDRARSGPCVEDPAVMRRIHMDVVRHGRNETVRQGIRDRKTSLAACVDCHANAKDGSVVGSGTHFCQGCHAYAAVKLDCFECHSSRAREPLRTSAAAAKGGS
jgi:hypothetical protein